MAALSDKVAIITGASSGIGYATARLFANEKAKLIVAARRKEKLDSLVREIIDHGGEAVALAGDVRDEGYQKGLVDLALAQYGGLDVAFNNAGTIGRMCGVTDLDLVHWHEAIDTNLTSAFLAAKYQIPALKKRGGGSIVFTATIVGYTVGFPNVSAYAASKAGLIGLTQALATEYGVDGIRINALLPGGTDTPMGREFASTPEAQQFVQGLHALKRIALPEEIAKSVLYLVSDASSFTTGTALLADGGVSISRT